MLAACKRNRGLSRPTSAHWRQKNLDKMTVVGLVGRVGSPEHRLLSLIAAHRSPSQLLRLLTKIPNQTNNYRTLQPMITGVPPVTVI